MRLLYRLLIIALAAFTIAACIGDPPPPPPPECPDPDPVFRELYDQLGGQKTLGCPISVSFNYTDPSTNRDMLCQYTAAVLLVHDPFGPDSLKQGLAPIGNQMGIAQPAVPRPEGSDVRWVEGHIIYDKFVPLYERLGGMRYVGKPLTEVRYNPDRKRYEQYFENVGFYVLEMDESQTVSLLSYGAWMCDSNCRQQLLPDSSMIGKLYLIAPEFRDAVGRLGADFTGFAISDAYDTPDGYREQVFENIVLVADPSQPGRVFPRAITPIIGTLPDLPVPRSSDPESYFYPVQGELGYNIPKQFMDYIAQHGGLEVTGQPISERLPGNNDIFQQCFMNLCLEESLKEPDYRRIHPAQVGYPYRKFPVSSVTATPSREVQTQATEQSVVKVETPAVQAAAQPVSQTYSDPQTASQISMQVWTAFPMIAPNQSQEIGVMVFENNAPMVGVEPDITITLPDGNTRTYYMYPTGGDGQSRLQIDPIAAPNMTLIPYEVCIFLLGGQKLCVKGQYLIQDIP